MFKTYFFHTLFINDEVYFNCGNSNLIKIGTYQEKNGEISLNWNNVAAETPAKFFDFVKIHVCHLDLSSISNQKLYKKITESIRKRLFKGILLTYPEFFNSPIPLTAMLGAELPLLDPKGCGGIILDKSNALIYSAALGEIVWQKKISTLGDKKQVVENLQISIVELIKNSTNQVPHFSKKNPNLVYGSHEEHKDLLEGYKRVGDEIRFKGLYIFHSKDNPFVDLITFPIAKKNELESSLVDGFRVIEKNFAVFFKKRN